MSLRLLHKAPGLRISHDDDMRWIYAQWQGALNQAVVVDGCERLEHYLREEECCKLLSDNTLITQPWPQGIEWGARVWLPAMAAAGLKYMAWVYSPHMFGRLAFDRQQPVITDLMVAAFDDVAAAYAWLHKR